MRGTEDGYVGSWYAAEIVETRKEGSSTKHLLRYCAFQVTVALIAFLALALAPTTALNLALVGEGAPRGDARPDLNRGRAPGRNGRVPRKHLTCCATVPSR